MPRPLLHQSWSTGWNELVNDDDDDDDDDDKLIINTYINYLIN